tara:strand:- start:239 stop:430 length:192 start_codon:yes stop_codon:yes gene_type:complete
VRHAETIGPYGIVESGRAAYFFDGVLDKIIRSALVVVRRRAPITRLRVNIFRENIKFWFKFQF